MRDFFFVYLFLNITQALRWLFFPLIFSFSLITLPGATLLFHQQFVPASVWCGFCLSTTSTIAVSVGRCPLGLRRSVFGCHSSISSSNIRKSSRKTTDECAWLWDTPYLKISALNFNKKKWISSVLEPKKFHANNNIYYTLTEGIIRAA